MNLKRDGSGDYILRFWTNGHRQGSALVYRNLGPVSYADAAKRAAVLVGQAKARRTSADPHLTFSTLADLYLEEEGPHLSPRGRALAEMALRCHLRPFFGLMRVEAIRPADVERYRRQRTCLIGKKVRRKSERPVAPSTMNREWSLLRAVLNFGERTERIERNPIRRGAVRLLPAKPREGFFELDEWKDFIASAEGGGADLASTVPFWRALLLTGRRISELAALRWKDVDFERGVCRFYQTKTDRPVTLPLAGELAALLRALSRFRRIEGDSPVFLDAKAEPFKVTTLQTAFRRIARRAGVAQGEHGRLSPHSIRHTAATWQRREGVPQDRIKETLGHRDLRMTMRYAHIRPEDLSSALDVLAGVERAAREGNRERNGNEARPEGGRPDIGFTSQERS